MSERLWSGDGCAGNPNFEFVKHADSGVPLYRKIAAGEVRLVQGGATHIIKRAEDPAPTPTEEIHVNPKDAVADAIEKLAKAAHPNTTTAQAVSKFLGTEAGEALYSLHDTLGAVEKSDVSFEKIAAHAALESLAATIRKARPELSAERAYVEGMNRHPEIAALAIG